MKFLAVFAAAMFSVFAAACSHWHPLLDCEGNATGSTLYHVHYPVSHDGSQLPMEPHPSECGEP